MNQVNKPNSPKAPEAIVICSPEDHKNYRTLLTTDLDSPLSSGSDTSIDPPLVIANAGSYIGVDSLNQILTYLQMYPTINTVAVVVNKQDQIIDAIDQCLANESAKPPIFHDIVDDVIKSWRQLGSSNETLSEFSRDEIAVALSELMVVRLANHLSMRSQSLLSDVKGQTKDLKGDLDLERVLVGGFISDNTRDQLAVAVPLTQAGIYSDKVLRASTSQTR